MHRIDGPGTVEVMPAPRPAGTPGFFDPGNPAGGRESTMVTYEFMNAVQEEISKVIEGAGIPLNKEQNNQLLAAIRQMIGGIDLSKYLPFMLPDALEAIGGHQKLNQLPNTVPTGLYLIGNSQATDLGWSGYFAGGYLLHLNWYNIGTVVNQYMFPHDNGKIFYRFGTSDIPFTNFTEIGFSGAFPSGQTINLSVPANGSGIVTAPADGYAVFLGCSAITTPSYATILCKGVESTANISSEGQNFRIFVPVTGGAAIYINYYGITPAELKLVKSKGAL